MIHKGHMTVFGAIALSAILFGVAVTSNINPFIPSMKSASASDINCGDTVSGVVDLHEDISGAGGICLTVGADDTIINLNGFEIVSASAGSGIGIFTDGHTGVLINGPGTIEDWGTGIFYNDGSSGAVQGVLVTAYEYMSGTVGIFVFGISCPTEPETQVNIHHNEIEEQAVGILIANVGCVNIHHNDIHDMSTISCFGSFGDGIIGSNVVNSQIHSNNLSNNFCDGLQLAGSIANVNVLSNSANDNGDAGMRLTDGGGAKVTSNSFDGNSCDLVEEPGNTTPDNKYKNNTGVDCTSL
jgi:hypothetical protein